MKLRIRNVAAAAGLGLAAPCLAQWQYQGTSIYYNSGFVGVGTTAPTTSAELFGLLGNTNGWAGMYARTTGASGLPFYGYKAGGSSVAWHYLDGASGTWLLYNNGDRFSVTNGGNVGVGTRTPAFKLDVAGTGRVRADGGVGDALLIGGSTVPMGLTTEGGGSMGLVNLDLNFHCAGKSNSVAGGAVRLDSRSGFPTIQLITRPAGSSTETTALGVSSTGLVGIGTSTPAFPLHVMGPGWAVLGDGQGAGVVGNNHGVADDPSYRAAAAGVLGFGLANEGAAVGVWGMTFSPQGTGVVGTCYNGGGTAVRGLTFGPDSVGMYGEAYNGSTPYGPGTEIGVFGSATDFHYGTAIGVKGRASAHVYGYGVFSEGPLGATGTKAFRIDHPADPANKYLLHYCAEGPEPQNVYNGVIRLDGNGSARVALPAYFASINRDPRYSLTAVGAAMPLLHIGAKIDERSSVSEFVIDGGAPGGEVSWEVKAVRNDAWVRAHGAPVEIEKPAHERGTYQHPELYGQPAEKGLPPLRPASIDRPREQTR